MTRMIPIFALALAVPAGLMAQDAGASDQIDDAMARAEAAGVPIALLEAKQAEGLAKGVPLDRIAEVMDRRADALIAAREAMPESDARAVAAGADAVEAGIGPDVLGFVENTVPSERRYVATYVLSRLVELGHAPEHALTQVENALAHGPDALGNLPDAAEEARKNRHRFGPPAGIGPAGFGVGAFGAGMVPSFAGPPGGIAGPGGQHGPPSSIPTGSGG